MKDQVIKSTSLILAGLLCAGLAACVEEPVAQPQSISMNVYEQIRLPDANQFKWTSSDEDVVTANGGVITAKGSGNATVSATVGEETVTYQVTVNAMENETKTIHHYNVTDSDVVFFEGGTSDYKIVYSADETDEMIVKDAVNELQTFIREATGVTVPVISDKGLRYTDEAKYLSVGENALSEGAGFQADKQLLGQNGYSIFSGGNSVFLLGGGRFGTLYSVYEFLKWQFGYEQYAVDEFKIMRGVTDMKMKNFNVVDVPDFSWRLGNNGEYWFGDTFPKRMRMQRTEDIWIQLGGLPWHNFKATVPPSVHQAAHPDWFSPDGVQLCLSRDIEGLSNEVVAQMKLYIEANPHLSNLTFTQEDVNVWCDCPSCSALKSQYGVNSASNIRFINVVAKKLKAWLDEVHPEREITVVIFAYHQVEEAPAMLNASTGKYEPIDETVVLEDNVAVMYAPIFANHYHDFGEQNTRVDETMKKWQALTDKIYLWAYSTYFVNYLTPFDSFNALQSKYIYAYENNVRYLFDQQQYNQNVGTDWYRLKEYLSSKMAWDIHADMDALIDDFFVNYFKDASAAMKKYFTAYRTWFAYLSSAYGVGGTIGERIDRKIYWPKALLAEWLGYMEEAKQSVAPLKQTDPALHQKLVDRITLESISIRHLDLVLYEDTYSPSQYKDAYLLFKEDCGRLGVNNYNEWNAVDQYFNQYEGGGK